MAAPPTPTSIPNLVSSFRCSPGSLTISRPGHRLSNGIDSHIDWGASKFLTPQLEVGLAGYFFRQLTGDSGKGEVLGDFEFAGRRHRPADRLSVPAGDKQGYLNLRAAASRRRAPRLRLERVRDAVLLAQGAGSLARLAGLHPAKQNRSQMRLSGRGKRGRRVNAAIGRMSSQERDRHQPPLQRRTRPPIEATAGSCSRQGRRWL